MTNDNTKDSFVFDNYVGYHNCRSNSRGGGVAIYVNDSFVSSCLTELCVVSEILEVCTVKVNGYGLELYLLAIYRPPGGCVNGFLAEMSVMINHNRLKNEKIVVLGDLNINLLEESNYV